MRGFLRGFFRFLPGLPEFFFFFFFEFLLGFEAVFRCFFGGPAGFDLFFSRLWSCPSVMTS